MMQDYRPVLYVLVGLPASGKSTWAQQQKFVNTVIVNTDKHVQAYADSVGQTYSDVFTEYMPCAIGLMMDEVHQATADGKNIIWDQTSTTQASRIRKFTHTCGYRKVAVIFRTPDSQEHKRRLASRPGKVIPIDVLATMSEQWQEPTQQEGFDEIWYAQ
jgi:predicted kinase